MSINRLSICLLQTWFGAAPLFASAEAPQDIVLSQDQFDKINKKTVYFLDEKNLTTVQDAIVGQHEWQHFKEDNVAFGLDSSTVWIHLKLTNHATSKVTTSIELNPVFLEWITAYDSSGKVLDQTGSKVAPHRVEAFPTLALPVEPGSHDFYISIRSRSNSVAMFLRSASIQAQKDTFDLIMASALLGGLLTLMVYHLFMFATYRNRNYLLYSLFIASSALFSLSFTSYHRQLLPAKMFGFETDFWWSAMAAEIMFFGMYLFSADLLGLFPGRKGRRKWLSRCLLGMPILQIAVLTMIFATDNPIALLPVRLSSALQILILPTLATVLWIKDRNNITLYYAISWIPFGAGVVSIVLWLSGAVGHNDILPWSVPIGTLAQSLLLSFAASQRLKKRDKVITSFVSSDIVSELDRSEDPLSFLPRNVEKCIVFLDMHDYTTFSEAHTPMECHGVLNEYFSVINQTTYANHGKVDKIIGDAMMLVFDQPRDCLSAVVALRKNLSSLNKNRVAKNLLPIKFGVGISYGKMLSANFGSKQKFDRTLVGDNVNIASRLEAITRLFAVDVLCSKEFADQHPGYEFFRPAGYVLLKGKQKKSLVYEMFEHNLPQVVAWKKASHPILLKVIDLELDGHYLEAIAELRNLIDRCPPHSFRPGQIMDPTLFTMINAIEEKMRQLGLRVPTADEISAAQRNLRKAA